MKSLYLSLSAALLLAAAAIPSRASSITWINTEGGNWSGGSNWSSGVVPGPQDTALITVVGEYPVYLDVDATVASLVVGASAGGGPYTEKFYTSGQTLTVNGLILVNAQGQFNLDGGGLAGTNELSGDAHGSGPLIWSGGTMSGTLVIDEKSTLSILGGGNVGFNGLVLTNNGTVNWTNAAIYGYGPGNAQIYNFGSWNEQGDDTFTGGYGGGSTLFENFGTFTKSGTSGTTALDAAVVFNNTGTVAVQSGTLDIAEGTNNGGDFTTATGAIVNFTTSDYDFTNKTTFTGIGSYLTSGATFGGTMVGTLNWVAGDLSGVMTVASGGALNISGGGNVGFNGLVLTNNGTINWTNTSIYGYSPGNAQIYNYGTWNAQSDDTFTGGYSGGSTLFDNFGTFVKTGNSGLTLLDADVVFNNTGQVTVQSGTLSIGGGMNSGSGTFTLANSGLLDLNNMFFANSATINGSGAVSLGGNTTMNGVLTASNLQLAGGAWSGTNVLVGTLTWSGGNMSGNMTLPSGSVLNIVAGGGNGFNGLVLTNQGTVVWSNTPVYSLGPDNAQIYNYGAWTVQSDDTFTGGYGGGTTLFDNFGTFTKSGSNGATLLDDSVVFNNMGTVRDLTGELDFAGGGTNSGGNMTTSGGATIHLINYLFTSTNTFTGPGSFVEGNTIFAGTIAGTLGWDGGDLSGALTIAPNSFFDIVAGGGNGFNGLVLTNQGTVLWTNTSLYSFPPNNAQIYNYGTWNEQSDDTFMGGYGGGSTLFDNFGTFRKAGSSGVTTLDASVVFNNTGTLDAQSGNISLQGAYNLANGTLNFGISSLTNYGSITLAGAAALTGAISANLNNGYQPVGGNSFTNLYYDSFTGMFTNALLPSADAWSTNYDPTYFVMNVLNARPIFVASTTNVFVVNELATLIVTNKATDLESPPQTLTYGLISGPSGIVVNSTTGLLTWMPQQTNSPSTNTVTVGVANNGTPSLNATVTYTIIVKEVNVAPILPVSSVKTIIVQQAFSLTNSATEPNIHSVTAGYLLLAPPAGAAIDSSGVITWTPAQNQSLTTNTITTVVTNSNPFDLVNPHLSATNTITVIVLPNIVPTNLVALHSAGNILTLSWPGDHAGWRLEAQTNSLNGAWETVAGSSATNLEIIPVVLTNKAVFFRLIYP